MPAVGLEIQSQSFSTVVTCELHCNPKLTQGSKCWDFFHLGIVAACWVRGCECYSKTWGGRYSELHCAQSKLKSCHLMQVLLRPLTNLESHMLSLGYKMVYSEIHLCLVGGICGLALVRRIPKLSCIQLHLLHRK